MSRLVFLSLVFVGCSDYEIKSQNGVSGKYNPPEVGVQRQVDSITQVTVPAVDVLWVLDNSCSMEEEQRAIQDNFPQFMRYFTDSGLDYHVGLVSTDMDNRNQSGQLVTDRQTGERFIDSTMDADTAVASFRERAQLGTGGSADERGKDAAFAALVTYADSTNRGFYRDDAILNIVVVSDERDYSRMSVTEFVSWMLGMKAEPDTVSFSSVVGPRTGCATAEAGVGYREVTEQVGGIEWSICTQDWSGLLTELGLQAAGLKREFFLTQIPVEESIKVEVEDDRGSDEYDVGDDWTYDAKRNSITFVEFVPDPLTVVRISYIPLAEAESEVEEDEDEDEESEED